MRNIIARHSKSYYLIIASIAVSLLLHYGVVLLLSNVKTLNLGAFEERMRERFEIETVSQKRVELERMYREYDSPEDVSVLKESPEPEQMLKNIPHTELEAKAPETEKDFAPKFEMSTSDEIKNQLQKDMLEKVGRPSYDDTKLFKDDEID
ncbi:MAG: hypothetical protein ACYSR0_06085, partial [Planctomycetota bacterium]